MLRLFFLFTILGAVSTLLHAQSQFPVVQIYTGNSSYINEPTICINPKNVNQVVAGSVLNDFYYSSNAGDSWTHGTLSCQWGVWGDPVVIVDTSQNFYYFHLAYPPSPGWWIDRIICQKSTDAGHTWSSGTYMGKNTYPHAQDKHWAVVDRRNNNIYVTWTEFDSYGSSSTADSSIILFAKSTDGGQTWTNPAKRISKVAGDCHDDDNTVEGAVPCVGPNGEIYVSWAGPLGIVFNRSTDQGTTWVNNNIFVTNNPGGWNYSIPGIDRSNGLPVTCCDLSNSPYHGTLYINWSDQRNGASDTDVWLVKSTDNGNTWSSPIRVNDDPAGKQQFFTWMTVDPVTGYIYIVFYDRRNYTDNQTDVYMAVSRDGGASFENMRISSAPFTPNSGVFFGDYTNISAYNNVVRPIWTALSGSSTKTIYTALIDTLYPINSPLQLSAKVYLEGPYSNGGMTTSLRNLGVIPTAQPYGGIPWNYCGSEQVSTIPPSVTDWVLVELRSAMASSSSVSKRAGFLKSDGQITDLDGSSPLSFSGLNPRNYYVVIYHRNHKPILSSVPIAMSGTTAMYDFSLGSGQVYGGINGYKLIDPSLAKWGMISGDATNEGNLFIDDYTDYWVPAFGFSASYSRGDLNLDGNVFIDDFTDFWVPNFGINFVLP